MGKNIIVNLCPDGSSYGSLCSNFPDIQSLVSVGLNILLLVAFVAALAFIIIGGIRWITSGGDKEGTAKAKNSVTAAVIGLIIVLSAWIIIGVIANFFKISKTSLFGSSPVTGGRGNCPNAVDANGRPTCVLP